ncbi:protein CANDIDATE G-PROTEIN COUPLED RECEPTOR 7-like [Mercurialis annua]|uniref:protein CANDIDATE G-PROTEIN COUPLED RECEPTOR 7-like n=1 Tax=Mercurialis annua TaxID=3986 RepID=UPI0021601CDB|nr:protein CANDIDATE G-PROTEIN COUPLED RECEPTOR 7-like [Mercurialis annua]
MMNILLRVLLIISAFHFVFSEIKNIRILDDSRSMILFERFGFTEAGRVHISVKDVYWKTKHRKVEYNPSSMGFFLARDESFIRIMNESQFTESFCVLSSRYVQLILKFDNLTANSTNSGSITINDPDEYSLVFGNCQPEFEVSMFVHTEMYNLKYGVKDFLPAGQTHLPRLYFMFFLIYACFFGLWIFTCIKQRPTVDKIHLIMGALLLVKTLKMICASEDKVYVSKTGTPHGWDVAFYIFGFFKGIMLFTVIVLIGTGWSFLKPYLQEREKNVLMTVIPLQVLENIAYVVIAETGPATKDWLTWNQMFLLIDVICCCAVFFPIIWSIRSLREASKTDGKAARNLQKLTLFKQFYIFVVGYLYFTRVVVSSIGALLDYRYEWITSVLAETASLIFYIFIFYNFQPIEKNPYLVIDDEEESAASQILQEDDSFEL